MDPGLFFGGLLLILVAVFLASLFIYFFGTLILGAVVAIFARAKGEEGKRQTKKRPIGFQPPEDPHG
jgi:hypothetical protein